MFKLFPPKNNKKVNKWSNRFWWQKYCLRLLNNRDKRTYIDLLVVLYLNWIK
jgi:hypothetical protein